MARFIRWVAEPLTVFGIGALLNLILSAAAYAGVIGADRIDPDWIFLAGAAGGIVSALVHVGVVSLGSEPATSREIMRAVIEGVFAVVVGALVARFWAAPIALRLAPDINPSDLRAIGFGIGMGAWRFAPGLFGAVKLLSNPATLRDLALRWLGGTRANP